MDFAVEKGLLFTKYWCFRELVRRYSLTFLIMLSSIMNTDCSDFWSFVGFEIGSGLSFFMRMSIIVMTWLISFIFEDVTSVLTKCIVSSGYTWKTLSICISFALLFCFANFLDWQFLFYWIRFGVMDIEVSWHSSFFSEILFSFGLSHELLLLHTQELNMRFI